MLRTIARRFKIMRTISALCTSAENHALADGQRQPGAEHFLLAAFDLPDGTAQRIFEHFHRGAEDTRKAIALQYEVALQGIGIDTEVSSTLLRPPENIRQSSRLYKAQPSGQAVLEGLVQLKKEDGDQPLLGGHVLLVISRMQQGVAARALRTMGIDSAQLEKEAQGEIRRREYATSP
ncbi:hypothetical protein BA022_08715 [Diaphorobacter nitroreducens]|uniref:Clp protease N-terminal domain-containing protein n=1 Tax=Diaphorobacter nitroreducens TaxID=164759 RepID=UPI000B59A1CC|nr:Clp protease N-terminal domain-containing protein [Diaphorobacter nitroreducens]ASI68624.1 hypothetical protein BA022_08715 [Diaphorobacter nitroreducens]